MGKQASQKPLAKDRPSAKQLAKPLKRTGEASAETKTVLVGNSVSKSGSKSVSVNKSGTVSKSGSKSVSKSRSEPNGKLKEDQSSAPESVQRVKEMVECLKKIASEEKQTLLQDKNSRGLYLEFAFNTTVARAQTKPHLIKVPNPIYNEKHSICLITRDPQRFWKDKIAKEKEAMLKKEDNGKSSVEKTVSQGRVSGKSMIVPSKVIDFAHLRKNYPTAESRRRLMADYNVFYADHRLIHLIPQQLGATFIKKNRSPLPLKISKLRSTLETINEAAHKTHILIKPGSTTAVKVAHLTLDTNKIAENIVLVIQQVNAYIATLPLTQPKIHSVNDNADSPQHVDPPSRNGGIETTNDKWQIRSIQLKLSNSATLPLYSSQLH